MMKHEDFLIEILTEELPPKSLLKFAETFCQLMEERVRKSSLQFKHIHSVATPRRIAVIIAALESMQAEQTVERKGPAKSAAFDGEGNPTPACAGFARSCGITPAELTTIKTPLGEWVGYTQTVPGKSIFELMPEIVQAALIMLPLPKRMRWGDGEAQFVRPVQAVTMLYGDDIIEAAILGCETDRMTRGHRFHAPEWISIPNPSEYASLLKTEGRVMVDFAERKDIIRQKASALVQEKLGADAELVISNEDLLNEVTGLVEWPVALFGNFDAAFLRVPQEVLISSMQDHQRYFPVRAKKGGLLPHFVTISNIESRDPTRVIQGNERVLRARLSDAAFFFEKDKSHTLVSRLEGLKEIVFQAKLGTLYEKSERLAKLCAKLMGPNSSSVDREAALAGMLAKADLTTHMVSEFPELQGVMGYYYAHHDGLSEEIAVAIKEQYMPRFAGDHLPTSKMGQALAIADRIDTLVGTFGINHIPTGEKDPFGLRRAALGIIRILIENENDVDVGDLIDFAVEIFAEQKPLENRDTQKQVWNFILERLRGYELERGIPADIFASVAALEITKPFDIHRRLKAVEAFKKLSDAESLSIANKRVSNILDKANMNFADLKSNPAIFESFEAELARQLDAKSAKVIALSQNGQYEEVLLELASLRKPVDDFFDHVMVMTEDKAQRENRIHLLKQLRSLFLEVADIALLQ